MSNTNKNKYRNYNFKAPSPFLQSAAASCPDLSDPENGNVEVSGTGVGGTAIYSCDAGFTLLGEDRRVCTTDGLWSGSEPTCQGEFGPIPKGLGMRLIINIRLVQTNQIRGL